MNEIQKGKQLNNYHQTSRLIISLIGLTSLIYLSWWLNMNNAGNIYLYALLLVGEIFHVFQVLGFLYTLYNVKKPKFQKIDIYYDVAIFITVCGEPAEIVEKTIEAAVNIEYPNFQVYVLNDGFVAKKDNWEEIDALALKYGAIPITRTVPGGFKAGNINNALRLTQAPFVAIFDADHIPDPNFLKRTMGYFKNRNLALLQTPQFYENQNDNTLTAGAWEQQELFFGPICVGKNASNSAFWCGTNAIVRRKALEEIGGVPENNIAEDFLASMFMHEKGWASLYIPEILARGLAPLNLRDYLTQQFRWARGSLEMIFVYNPIFRDGLTSGQKFQYLWSASYYLSGLIILIDALIPVVSLWFNVVPVKAVTFDFLVYFFPFLSSVIFLLMIGTKDKITFRAVQLSSCTFYIFLLATLSTIFRFKVSFKVTPKSREEGNYLVHTIPHILYIGIGTGAIIHGIIYKGITPSVLNNISWTIFNMVFFTAFIQVAYPWEKLFKFDKLLAKPNQQPAIEYVHDIYGSEYALQENSLEEGINENE